MSSLKQTIQAFLARANEITALDVNNPALKKKAKNEKSEKTILFEKMEFLKKKLENESFFIVVLITFIKEKRMFWLGGTNQQYFDQVPR